MMMGIIIADDHLFDVPQNSALLLFIPSKLTILSEKDYIVIVFTFFNCGHYRQKHQYLPLS